MLGVKCSIKILNQKITFFPIHRNDLHNPNLKDLFTKSLNLVIDTKSFLINLKSMVDQFIITLIFMKTHMIFLFSLNVIYIYQFLIGFSAFSSQDLMD